MHHLNHFRHLVHAHCVAIIPKTPKLSHHQIPLASAFYLISLWSSLPLGLHRTGIPQCFTLVTLLIYSRFIYVIVCNDNSFH